MYVYTYKGKSMYKDIHFYTVNTCTKLHFV